MSSTTTPGTPESELTPELIERVLKLSRENLGRLVGLALDCLDGASDDPETVKKVWRDEHTRRWEAIRSGAMPTYTPEEALAYARERLRSKSP
jgi:hypothetical protein